MRGSVSRSSAVRTVGNRAALRALNTDCAASSRFPGSGESSVRPPMAPSIARRILLLTRTGFKPAGGPETACPVATSTQRLGFFLDEELPFGRVEQPAVGESLHDLGGAGIAALRHLGDGGLGLGIAIGGKTREGLLETRGAGRTGRNEHQGKRREKSGRTRRQIPHGMFRVALKGNGWESASPTRRFQAPWASCPARRTSSSWCCSCRTSASPSRRQGPSSRRAPSTRRRPARALPSSRPRRTGRRP